MTDNKIIEGLDCCRIENCHECPYRTYFNCRETMVQDTFNFINHQNAEIERLHASIKEVDKYLSEGDFASGIALIIKLVKEIAEENKDETLDR